ncbi:MAG: S41 family peptidase [Dehalococcoidales bacterium]|nr:S41 family peptidase [Dehalococcoidales bacterium]
MSKEVKIGLVSLLLGLGLGLSFGLGYLLGGDIQTQDPSFTSVEQAWNIILNDYVEKDKIDAEMLSQAAIEGMIALLDDPYTAYLDATAYQLDASDSVGEYSGIGASVGIQDGQLTVVAAFDGSPAAVAGVQAGDVILDINGVSTSGMDLYDAVLKVRGDSGTSVSLLILRQGDTEPVEIIVIRGQIEVPSVDFKMRGDIAYIGIEHFTERTNEELTPVLEAIAAEGAAGIVLDMRGNPGGLLNSVVLVTSRFLTQGEVLSVRDSHGNVEVYVVTSQELTTDLPMVVLVDGYSASGSEVVAGALQDHERAVIAGTATYGKGSANTMKELADGSGLYITIARWLTPDGHLIEGIGVIPDIELELTEEDAVQWAIDYLHGGEQTG